MDQPHVSNHPPDGYVLPRFIPAIIGRSGLSRYNDPADLFGFIRTEVPMHNPGSLTDEDYWQLTAFLFRENGRDSVEIP